MKQIRSPLQAQLLQWLVAPAALVRAGDVVAIVEAMKMEHEVRAVADGCITELLYQPGDMVPAGELLCHSEPTPAPLRSAAAPPALPPEPALRADLQRLQQRLAYTQDDHRAQARAKRHAQGLRMARENIAALCDEGSFTVYG
ncbi:MAG: biotin/lipoyl-containing protein, partial [Rhodoferax sp.]